MCKRKQDNNTYANETDDVIIPDSANQYDGSPLSHLDRRPSTAFTRVDMDNDNNGSEKSRDTASKDTKYQKTNNLLNFYETKNSTDFFNAKKYKSADLEMQDTNVIEITSTNFQKSRTGKEDNM